MVYRRHEEMEFSPSHGLCEGTSPPGRSGTMVCARAVAGPGCASAARQPAEYKSLVSPLGGRGERGVAGSGSHRPQAATLGRRPVPFGGPVDRGSASPGVRDKPLDAQAYCSGRGTAFWRPLSSWSRVEAVGANGLELPTAGTTCSRAERRGHPAVAETSLAADQKKKRGTRTRC
jgi:hypothetical protein